jgi:hypothetical protein
MNQNVKAASKGGGVCYTLHIDYPAVIIYYGNPPMKAFLRDEGSLSVVSVFSYRAPRF